MGRCRSRREIDDLLIKDGMAYGGIGPEFLARPCIPFYLSVIQRLTHDYSLPGSSVSTPS